MRMGQKIGYAVGQPEISAQGVPDVSVIIPVYNAEEYLSSCLDSILAQSLKEIEVICVDDGSTDGSAQILEEYAAKDPRVVVVRQENAGAGAARNTGLEKAAGRYVVFWDADDSFRRDALEKMCSRCDELSADLCICSARKRDDETGTIYASGAYLNRKLLPRQEVFNRRSLPQYIFNVSANIPWNKMLRREFVLSCGLRFQELPQANDVFFSMTALYRARRICAVKDPLVIYRVENRGSLTGTASEYDLCTVRAFRAVRDELEKSADFLSGSDHAQRGSSVSDDDSLWEAGLASEKGSMIGPKLRKSFDNRTADALLYSLRKQWSIDVYRYLYDIYKNEVFPEFGLMERPSEHFYNPDNYMDIEQMKVLSADQFLLYLFHRYERSYLMAAGMTPAQLYKKVARKMLRR